MRALNNNDFKAEERNRLLDRISKLEAERNLRLRAEEDMRKAHNRIDEELGTLQKEREDIVQEIERLSLQMEENRRTIERLTEERIELSGRIKEAEKLLKELMGTS